MTVDETNSILKLLSGFYGQGKSDAKAMTKAWHLILKDYEYELAEKAVISFAKNDKREYAYFPSVGKVVEAIEQEQGKYNLVINSAFNEVPYKSAGPIVAELINHEDYNKLLLVDKEKLREKRQEFIKAIRTNTVPQLEGKAF